MSKKKNKINPSMQLPLDSGQNKPQVSRVHDPVTLSLRYCDAGSRYCLSHCEADELKSVVECLRKLNTLTWIQLQQQGGKGPNKTGLAYTLYDDAALKGATNPHISPDVRVAGIRVTQKMRIFGCCVNHIFFILWFDRNHQIIKG